MNLYKSLIKPFLFTQDAEKVHEKALKTGEFLGNSSIGKKFTATLFNYQDPKLEKIINGIKFKNPIGLAAGFDYNGNLAEILSYVGFGFNTVGTVTAKAYEGNKKPRLGRLPNSKSLFVNKGFKSLGADAVYEKILKKDLSNGVVGISVGSTNIPEIDTKTKAIDDYLYTFNKFKDLESIKYFELNISCPNTSMKEPFSNPKNFMDLVKEIAGLNIKMPIYVKMASENSKEETINLAEIALENNLQGIILSNLVKDRSNKLLKPEELQKFENKKGNFSGKPVKENSINLVNAIRKEFGKDITIIGVGGIFSYEDAKHYFDSGADLVQLITGMVFEGPSLICNINKKLSYYA